MHKRFYARKGEWFKKSAVPHFAVWWIEEGHEPTLLEARHRIEHLQAHGPGEQVFGWESLPNIKLWMGARCARRHGCPALKTVAGKPICW